MSMHVSIHNLVTANIINLEDKLQATNNVDWHKELLIVRLTANLRDPERPILSSAYCPELQFMDETICGMRIL